MTDSTRSETSFSWISLPSGEHPRANPATYLKAFDGIRRLLAGTPLAKERGYDAATFSFNVDGGRCPLCSGEGFEKIEMQFLSDVYVTCESCDGSRFRKEVLDVRYRDRNVKEILALTVDEALEFFGGKSKIVAPLLTLAEVELGYLRLGQPMNTLSGGEAQRLKLAAHMGRADAEGTLFLFDEPTTGLHFEDIRVLLEAFQRLLDRGASIVVIEHNLDVIKNADWLIDLGPEGGDAGGSVVASGTPEEAAHRRRGERNLARRYTAPLRRARYRGASRGACAGPEARRAAKRCATPCGWEKGPCWHSPRGRVATTTWPGPVPSARRATRSPIPASSLSTAATEPAPSVTGWDSSRPSTKSSWFPTRRVRSPKARSRCSRLVASRRF